MENLKEKAENLTEHVGDYFETYYKLRVLKTIDKASGVASSSIAAIAVSVIILFVMLFASIALGWWIGESLHNMVAGFFIVSGIYALIGTVVILTRKRTILPMLRNLIIKKAYE